MSENIEHLVGHEYPGEGATSFSVAGLIYDFYSQTPKSHCSAETNAESSYKPRKKKTEKGGWVKRQEKKWQNRKLLKIGNSNGGPCRNQFRI